MKTRAQVLVEGEVQGVFFRQETKRKAEDLNVKGWIRNRHDGGVEALFEGEDKDVQAMVEFCRRGPSNAVVKGIEVKSERYMGEFTDFTIRYY